MKDLRCEESGASPSREGEETFYKKWELHNSEGFPDPHGWGVSELLRLVPYLADNGQPREIPPTHVGSVEFHHRLAPSIITRGEADMLGLSDPRFARRVFLAIKTTRGVKWLGFVNLRRLGRLKDQASRWGRIRSSMRRRSWRFVWSSSVRKASSVADSVVCWPDGRFPSRQWVRLAMPGIVPSLYGEVLDGSCVPFLKHVNIFGGGMCAQACCFMGTMLMYPQARSVFATPEITAIARGMIGRAGPMELGGLSPTQVVAYFRNDRVGLWASYQNVPLSNPLSRVPTTRSTEYTELKTSISAYVRSGFPVILYVDMDRMGGRGTIEFPCPPKVYQNNGLDVRNVDAPDKKPRIRRHVVVAIGVSQDGKELVFNDPAHQPFLRFSLLDYLNTGQYMPIPASERERGGPQWALSPGAITPVVPRGVRLPLLFEHEVDEQGRTGVVRAGLLWVSSALNVNDIIGGGRLTRFEPPGSRPFWLMQIGQMVLGQKDVQSDLMKDIANADELIRELMRCGDLLCDRGAPSTAWVWIQLRLPSMIIVWDASQQTVVGDVSAAGAKRLVAAVGVRGKDARWVWHAGPAIPSAPLEMAEEHEPRTSPGPISLSPALITSFAAEGLSQAIAAWPHPSIYGDLYAFFRTDEAFLGREEFRRARVLGACMQLPRLLFNATLRLPHKISVALRMRSDRYQWIRRVGEKMLEPFERPDLNVCEWLASHCDNPEYTRLVAQRVCDAFRAAAVKCVAITTFLPEISAEPNSRTQRCGSRALKFLVRFAAAMNARLKEDGDGPIRTLEVVAGSLIDYVERRRVGGAKFAAQLLDKAVAIRRLCERLKELEADIRGSGVQIVIELEPGPLFVLSQQADLELMTAICVELEIADIVSANLDMAHWALGGVPLREIRGVLSSLIKHGHISGFGKGHFGDTKPDAGAMRDFFRNRLFLLHSLVPQKASGVVSLEMECARSKGYVLNGAAALRALLR